MTVAESTDLEELHAQHLTERQRWAEDSLAACGFDAVVLHAGTPLRYYADDQDAPHHSNPTFAHWLPLKGPYHLLEVRPDARPRLLRVAPEDYWYEQAPLGEPFWAGGFDIVEVSSEEDAWKEVATAGRVAYLGDAPAAARAAGLAEEHINSSELQARFDWGRSYKTDYEVGCIEEATRRALRGHAAAKRAFEGGGSELEIHYAYVQAAGCVDHELPYESIVALDEKGAILHYVGKRTQRNGRVLLIDSGATFLGYASDITRTWTREGCDALFRELIDGMEILQQELCSRVRPGLPYPDLHHRAHVLLGDLLQRLGILHVGGEQAVEDGLTRPFFPHGLGHFLGIQVHDVAGHQAEPEGGRRPPPGLHPFLRTTRTIEERQVFTIEPGCYFIEMLLRELRSGPRSGRVDWSLVDSLAPFGGVRIEDNVLVTADGHRNLTRSQLPVS